MLYDLTDAVEMNDADAARAAVDSGEYAAAIIIGGFQPAHQLQPAAPTA
ncbi:MAG: hypothetical protein U0694_05870 [Anaerolineae bacterium]